MNNSLPNFSNLLAIKTFSIKTIITLITFTSISCTPAPDTGRSVSGSEATVESTKTAQQVLTLEHDFGVVSPGTSTTCQMKIHNTTSTTWRFSHFRSGCGCTVGNISRQEVPAGESVVVTLSYRAPTEVHDDGRTVELYFHEPDAPMYRLQVWAKTRTPITVLPVALQFPQATGELPIKSKVWVSNYTKTDIAPPQFQCSHKWLSVGAAQPEPLPADDPAARQYWSVSVTLGVDTLEPGEHIASLSLVTSPTGASGLTVPIRVTLAAPLAPTPSQLFFGAVTPGQGKEVKFCLRIPSANAAEDLNVDHDLGGQLKVERLTSSTPICAWFKATLTPTPGADREIRGGVTIRARNGGRPTRIPVLASVVTNE